MMTIAIDIDDVINNLCECWCEWLSEHYNTRVSYQDVTRWDISGFFPELSKDQVFEPLHNPDFWDRVQPKEDAPEYIKKLMDCGHKVYLCTSTDYRNIQMKYEKIVKRYFPFIKWSQVIVMSDKQMLSVDVLIDDYIGNLIGGKYIKLLMDAPHNRYTNATLYGLHRVHNWEEIFDTIQTIEELQH